MTEEEVIALSLVLGLPSIIVAVPTLALMAYMVVTGLFDMVRLVLELTIGTRQSRVTP